MGIGLNHSHSSPCDHMLDTSERGQKDTYMTYDVHLHMINMQMISMYTSSRVYLKLTEWNQDFTSNTTQEALKSQ